MPVITVATLNLKKGELRWGERAPLLMQQLVALRPDIIGFQEVDLRLDQGNWICDRFNALCEVADVPPGYVIHHMANPRDNVSLEALGIMTHLPVLAHEGYDYLIRNRVAHRVRVDVEGRQFDFYNTHFHHVQDDEGHEFRRRQAQSLLDWIDERSGDVPAALVGDFNAPPNTRPIRMLKDRLRSAHDVLDSVQPTFPSPLVEEPPYPGQYTIDYIFVTDGARPVEARRVFDEPEAGDATLYPSDHFGLMARLELD